MANFFWFSYGGKNNVGEIRQVGERIKIDFPGEQEEAYGMAIRNGVDVSFKNPKSATFNICCDQEADFTVEIKTEASHGAPAISKNFHHDGRGLKQVSIIIEKEISPITEIVIACFKNINPGLVAEIVLEDYFIY